MRPCCLDNGVAGDVMWDIYFFVWMTTTVLLPDLCYQPVPRLSAMWIQDDIITLMGWVIMAARRCARRTFNSGALGRRLEPRDPWQIISATHNNNLRILCSSSSPCRSSSSSSNRSITVALKKNNHTPNTKNAVLLYRLFLGGAVGPKVLCK